MRPLHTLSLLLPFVLAGCGTTNVNTLVAEKGGEQLTPAQVLTLTEGNTFHLKGFDSDAYVYMDGSGRAFAVDTSENKDLGQWDVSEQGEYCLRMNSWWYSDLKCYMMYKVGDSYKLTDSNGLIKFSVIQYPGDYKNSYYAVNKGKKSYRKSIRSGAAAAGPVESAEPASPAETEVEAATALPPDRQISEENTYETSQEDKSLRSTVKWMARDCPGCNLSNTNLIKADLVGASLAGANLSGANLRMANLRRADLQGANLEEAILSHCNMPGANLRDANLKGADLKGANLIRADLTGADVTGADLEGALLEGVTGLKR